LVTNPELPAVTDALKAARLAEEVGTKVSGVVVNRVTGKSHELTRSDIINMLDTELLAEIPEDMAVQESISKRVPVLHSKPSSRPSQEIRRLAARLVGEEYTLKYPWYKRMFSFLR
jgi:MinD-like ATPase involved in chromosome partitioning or flagellar assembly